MTKMFTINILSKDICWKSLQAGPDQVGRNVQSFFVSKVEWDLENLHFRGKNWFKQQAQTI